MIPGFELGHLLFLWFTGLTLSCGYYAWTTNTTHVHRFVSYLLYSTGLTLLLTRTHLHAGPTAGPTFTTIPLLYPLIWTPTLFIGWLIGSHTDFPRRTRAFFLGFFTAHTALFIEPLAFTTGLWTWSTSLGVWFGVPLAPIFIWYWAGTLIGLGSSLTRRLPQHVFVQPTVGTGISLLCTIPLLQLWYSTVAGQLQGALLFFTITVTPGLIFIAIAPITPQPLSGHPQVLTVALYSIWYLITFTTGILLTHPLFSLPLLTISILHTLLINQPEPDDLKTIFRTTSPLTLSN